MLGSTVLIQILLPGSSIQFLLRIDETSTEGYGTNCVAARSFVIASK